MAGMVVRRGPSNNIAEYDKGSVHSFPIMSVIWCIPQKCTNFHVLVRRIASTVFHRLYGVTGVKGL